uniref:Ig-like domain-containing protein n=1 Tax=Trieres chinensis TaxID=1514140 RepID=A0A7S2EB08_TRICV|eukprot:CAMPEP_0183300426 /NCGR_PEP_ID=MMETSP0160_2-20130417/6860_1 /TAXON_ID=2839 ORGANISM="Odontella Sinensis, Strain Grunow 1884" /NCGR_SAMPLE_ID=MMETSP0160_2 /ASSEMBLY_ACC=CAM_ASM_000250 /LENGTH=124 /DNA_ID=CAMNT_0025462845 /DNA_START=107 /DNA_END=481 /DNA_ORIENTATION=-
MRWALLSYAISMLFGATAGAFVIRPSQPKQTFAVPRVGNVHVAASTEDASDDSESPVECYVVNDELVQTEGENPQVVCTSEPDEYAWFNGLEPNQMKPTDGTESGATECVEGASPRGTPEWNCE